MHDLENITKSVKQTASCG